MRSCPIRPTSLPVTSPPSPRTYETSTRIWHSMAEPRDWTFPAPPPRQRPPGSRPAGFWWWSLASARRNLSLTYLRRRGLRRHRRTPTLMACHAPLLQENGHEREALDPGKKALGPRQKNPSAPAKKRFEPGKKRPRAPVKKEFENPPGTSSLRAP